MLRFSFLAKTATFSTVSFQIEMLVFSIEQIRTEKNKNTDYQFIYNLISSGYRLLGNRVKCGRIEDD